MYMSAVGEQQKTQYESRAMDRNVGGQQKNQSFRVEDVMSPTLFFFVDNIFVLWYTYVW